MRLICPNCDAQYEVPDNVMPVAGRDVQCSNCGQTWFQHHADHMPDDDIHLQDTPAEDEEVSPPPPPHARSAPERKKLAPEVADILRQEAEAEQAARQITQSSGLESQPDLGMDMEEPLSRDEADRRTREASERLERFRDKETPEIQASGGSAPTGAATAVGLGSRRDLLPDIEEINSTLRSSAARSGGSTTDNGPNIEAPTRQRMRRGFRTGFLTVFLVFVILAVLYGFAARLSASVPALEAPLDAYVSTVDHARLWLDGKVQGMLEALDSMAASSN